MRSLRVAPHHLPHLWPTLRLNRDSVDVCELCYEGATEEEILGCQVDLDIEELDGKLERAAQHVTGLRGQTIVALALSK